MLRDFKAFIMRGNVLDLAVAVVIGAAFAAVVNSLVKDIITPLISAIGGSPDLSHLSFTLNGSVISYGNFLNAVISFVIMAAVIFFLVVQPEHALARLAKKEAEEAPKDEVDPQLAVLQEIRDELKKRS